MPAHLPRVGRLSRRAGAAVFAAVFAVPALLAAQSAPLHLVSTAWAPFTNAPGEARFALDLVEEALRRAGVTADTMIVDESRFAPALVGGEFDGSAATWKDADRERVLLFSEPYLENRLLLVGRRGSDVSATSLDELAGKRVVLVGGYAYGEAVASARGPIFLRSSGEEDSLAMLLRDDADYTLMDELVVEYILNNYSEQARSRLAFGSTPLVTRPLYLAIRRDRPDAAAIIGRFNAELRGMMADRTYHRLLHVDWIRADVDGDGVAEIIAAADQAGPTPPDRTYELFVATPEPTPTPAPNTEPRFFFGGNIYEGWTAVPERYKVRYPNRPDPQRSSFTIFRFEW